jgi:Flp pilus assembly protein TadD
MPTLDEVLRQAWQVHQSGNIHAAMQTYRGVLHQVPTSADAWVYLGIAQFDSRDFVGSVESYRRSIQLKPHFPVAWNNLGNSLRMLAQIDEAESCFETALEQQPGYLSAIKNRGTLWVWAGEVERGLKWYAKGLELDPNNAELHRNLGVISLLLGDLARGFDEYRWRWQMPGVARAAIAEQMKAWGLSIPVWSGKASQPIAGKTFLIYPEQGLGDAIHFVRMADRIHREGGRVIVAVLPPMVPLLGSASGIDQVVPDLPGMFEFASVASWKVDYQGTFIEILDGFFQRDGVLETGDRETIGRGYLSTPVSLNSYWQRWLEQNVPGRIRIGINWQGNPGHHADVYRSVPLSAFAPLISVPGLDFVNLQFGHGVEQLAQVAFGNRIHRLPGGLDESSGQFMDTAAIVQNLDAVVTSDTAIAHLAGALGKQVHLLLGKVPDWRWLTLGDSTPWYPSMRLYRQQSFGDWQEPTGRIVKELAAFFG